MDPIVIFFICWYILSIILVIVNIGKPREATTPGVAAFSVVILLFFIYLMTRIGG